jgi:hypothetical protein
MRLPNGRTFTVSAAAKTLDEYDRVALATWDLYDNLEPGPRNEFRRSDVLAINALNAFGRGLPMRGMTGFWSQFWSHESARHRAEELLGHVDERNVEAMRSEDEVTDATSKLAAVANVISDACRGSGFGDVATAKLLHRMRPGLAAIYDSRVYEHYRQTSWEAFYRAVALDVWNNQDALRIARARSRRRGRTLIRAWDILMWWRASS